MLVFSIIFLMIVRLLCTLTIFSFVCTSILEAQEFSFPNTKNELSKNHNTHISSHSTSVSEEDHCDDCQDDGCSDTGNCCQRICSCSTSFFSETKSNVGSISSSTSSKIEWYFYSNYRSPLLDPALKPPLFS